MNDITAQLRRGIKSTGFVMAVVLQLFALTYVHMDAGLFWRDPLEYFQCGDFYYTFFISTEQGLHWLTVPIVAILPMGFVFADDHQSGYINLILYRQRRRNYVVHRAIAACLAGAVAMLTALLLYTGFIALVTPWTNEGTGWQEIAMIGPYGWRASSDYFCVLIFECFGRLALSAVIWTLYGLALSNIWRNRIFIIVAVIATNLFLESFVPARMGIMNSLSYLQIPQCGTDQPLTISGGDAADFALGGEGIAAPERIGGGDVPNPRRKGTRNAFAARSIGARQARRQRGGRRTRAGAAGGREEAPYGDCDMRRGNEQDGGKGGRGGAEPE